MGFWQQLNEKAARSNGFRTFAVVVTAVAAIVLVLVLVTVVVEANNNQKVGESHTRHAQSPAVTLQSAALTLLEQIPVKGRAPKTGYSCGEFGPRWTDNVDVEGGHNGCDTRNDILRRDLSDAVTVNNCRVLTGVLHDPYTGREIHIDREEGTAVLVQIDHVVPLLDAWQKGAQEWDPVKRVQFANDPLNLLAVSGKANRAKKDGDVATWLPENKDFRCDYVVKVVEVKAKYGVRAAGHRHPG